MLFFKKNKAVKVKSANYKRASQLTEDDFWLINADREMTGIDKYSDEYYYNNILFYNYV